ncbi:hypothetical protein BDM02DRAFT_2830777 [Thelephora ganbajun]|uniref:Uncharacterized protein n=1 Tax=Thelephora ganbajun TaxID=370292 RepID=A0ACB6ZBL3_THEGA|nr:hypothetical protein BDM02DRAFT_2830777 [Thelephora ganbajun]
MKQFAVAHRETRFTGAGLLCFYGASTILVKSSKNSLRHACIRGILKTLRAMIDGPNTGRKPTPEDWERTKFGAVLYVDKDGFLSPTPETDRGTHLKFRTDDGYNQEASLPTPESYRKTYPMGSSVGNDDPGAIRQVPGMDEPVGYGAIQPGDLPPPDLFSNPSNIYDRSVMSGFSWLGDTNNTNGINGVIGGDHGVHIEGDSSSMLPMELMIYNDLMTDIKGTAKFLGQEFQDSILFGPTPSSSPTPAGQHPDRGPEPPSTMYGWVLPSVRSVRRRC